MNSKLESLQQWRNSELDQAQVVHAKKQAIALRDATVVDDVRLTIESSQDAAREQMSENRVLSVESLSRVRHFTVAQTENLKVAQATLANSRQEAEASRAVITEKFEELAVLERLTKRRDVQALKETLRIEQRTLDDQAILRSTVIKNENYLGKS